MVMSYVNILLLLLLLLLLCNFYISDPLPDYLTSRINYGHVINDKRNRGVSMAPMLSETRSLLDNFLKPFNDRLRQLLGNEFKWREK